MKVPEIFEIEKFANLTTKGRNSGRDHIVELWFALSDEKIYLSHEGEYTDWMRNLLKDSSVKLTIGPETIFGKAKIAPPYSLAREAGKRALYLKYYGAATKETIDDWFELSHVIEVTPQ